MIERLHVTQNLLFGHQVLHLGGGSVHPVPCLLRSFAWPGLANRVNNGLHAPLLIPTWSRRRARSCRPMLLDAAARGAAVFAATPKLKPKPYKPYINPKPLNP